MIQLRPQQMVFEDAIRDAFRRVRTVLAVAPTGFGALTARKKYGSMVAVLETWRSPNTAPLRPRASALPSLPCGPRRVRITETWHDFY